MKNEQEIKAAIKSCDEAQAANDPKQCPIWPDEPDLYCVDCTCRYAMRWILTGDSKSEN
jgi:hypothetical protein